MARLAWKAALRQSVENWVSGNAFVKQCAYDAFERHVTNAYQAGLTAGRSQAGYRLVKENERLRTELARYETEESCPSPSVPTADGSSASAASAGADP
jgi:hypothetical protein